MTGFSSATRGGREDRRHDGRVAVGRSNLRWCSDGFEIGRGNGEKVRVAFALDCCDREGTGFVAATEGIEGEDVQDLMIAAVEHRFGQVNRLPETIEWLTDNGSASLPARRDAWRATSARHVRPPFRARNPTAWQRPSCEPMKRDHIRVLSLPDARTVMEKLPIWFEHYNTVHPHKALEYRSPRESIAQNQIR